MRAAIYGAGSIGTVIGAYITKNGGQIDLINRNKSHVEALQQDGATILGTVNFVQPVTAYTPEEMSGTYDIILLTTRKHNNREVATFLKDYLAEDGVIVSLQNGLPEPLIAEIVGEDRVLGCSVALGAIMLVSGISELTSDPDSLTFSIGGLSSKPNKKIKEVKALLEKVGTVYIEENFIGSRWTKLLVNSSFSGMSAVLGASYGKIVKNLAARKIIHGLMKECIDVCAKNGIKLVPIQGKDVVKLFDYQGPIKKAIANFMLPIAIKKHILQKSTIVQDLKYGRKTEVDQINGIISAYGKKVGHPTPLNDKVVEIVHCIESGKLDPSFDNLIFFQNFLTTKCS